MESSTATAERSTTRPKATPDFRVFREIEDGSWENMTPTQPIEAANKKAAIREAAGADGEGRFLAIRDKEYNPLSRKVGEVEIVRKAQESWG